MHLANTVTVAAPPRRIFDLAAPVERWPALLPHYRWVKVLEVRGHTRLVEMACWRDGIPLRWTALEEALPDVPRIRFLHVAGITRGMEVAWEFTPVEQGTEVRIDHDLRLAWPLIGSAVARRIIGPLFISDIAGKTLRRVKALAESTHGG